MNPLKNTGLRSQTRAMACSLFGAGVLGLGVTAVLGVTGVAAASSATSASATTSRAVVSASTAYTFRTIDDPADRTFNQLLGINDVGRVAGYFGSGASPAHPNKGYTFSAYTGGRIWQPENFPGSAQTQVTGLNDVGQQVGFWVDASGNSHGFWVKRSAGQLSARYVSVSDPLAAGKTKTTQLLGINNAGEAVGFYNDAAGNAHAFAYSTRTGAFSALPIPNATSVMATGINDAGKIVGTETTAKGATEGFVLTASARETITVPGASATSVFGVNDKGQLVGAYAVGKAMHGFLWHGGRLVQLDDPSGVGTTTVNGLNNLGDIVGFYTDAQGNTHGFVGAPTYPAYEARVPGA